ncbi:MAG: ATP-binding protein [Pseudomonadota bacterium]
MNLPAFISRLQHSLVLKLIIIMGGICLLAISTWAYFSIRYQHNKSIEDTIEITERISRTIRLGTHYAMMLNSRSDINQIIQNVSTQKGIENVRIFNKQGYIKFSNSMSEVNQIAHLDSEACNICHRQTPPLVNLELSKRTRIFKTTDGRRLLGMITPIYNEPGCSGQCHFHTTGSQVLGAMDVVISLQEMDAELSRYERSIVFLAVAIFIVPSLFIFLFVYRFVIKPISQLTEATKTITRDTEIVTISTDPKNEIGRLAAAFNTMRQKIHENQLELTKQKYEYQNLFERVPCLITVQDRNLKLINFNREFYNKYNPSPGDYCFQTYKGRKTKCDNCPVEKTFRDGQSHYSEEQGKSRDGTMEYWIVRTSPVKNAAGEIVAAMEINLDITQRKKLEQKLEESEKKYHAIFNNIPNPVFVLDYDTLTILDCNDSVQEVYEYTRTDLVGKSFTVLFAKSDTDVDLLKLIRESAIINSVRHYKSNKKAIFVDIWISISEYPGNKVLLVTTSDITERLETEAQFNQATKLATLGEMATGVAHELNQPLSVIKTSSSFCISKINKAEIIQPEILKTLLTKIDTNVDRASRIITHMRDFARKSDVSLEEVNIVEILKRAYEIFSQQLKVRGINVFWDVTENLPQVKANPGRLEQVFINLLINARDAIESKVQTVYDGVEIATAITIRAYVSETHVCIEIEDTGTGIPEDIVEKIFQPFFTTKEVGKGTGLGLSISYGIIKDCSGEIRIKKTSDQGTVFLILIPIQKQEG